MAVTAQMVKELRDLTGAGMMDCKKALVATEGNIEAAVDWLREKGIASAAKKADRIAAEGLCDIVVDGDTAVIFELNAETDFVAKNDQFLALLNTVGQALITNKPATLEEALASTYEGKTVEAILTEATSTIGEKISLRRLEVLTKEAGQLFGVYKHMGGRIASITLVEGEDEEVARDLSMHITASKPLFLDETGVDPEVLAHEREMFKKEFENELAEETNEKAKEAKLKRLPQIVDGKVNKWLKESSLIDQPFVKNPDVTISQFVSSNDTKVLTFVRYEVGEGIEKKVDNFADEVRAQIRG